MFSYKKALKTSKNMLYSPLKKCTWRFKILKMNDSSRMLLVYTIIPNINADLDYIKEACSVKELMSWTNLEYAIKVGKEQERKIKNNKAVAAHECNICGLIIDKDKILYTNNKKVIEILKRYANKEGYTIEKEDRILRSLCSNLKLSAIAYQPKYTYIAKNSRVMEKIKPEVIMILNPDCIIDAASGEEAINKMIEKYKN